MRPHHFRRGCSLSHCHDIFLSPFSAWSLCSAGVLHRRVPNCCRRLLVGRTLSKVTVNPPCARDGYRSDCVVQKDRHACTAATQNGPVCELCTRTRPGQVARQAPFPYAVDRLERGPDIPTRVCTDSECRRVDVFRLSTSMGAMWGIYLWEPSRPSGER